MQFINCTTFKDIYFDTIKFKDYIDTMTIWIPELDQKLPRYLAIATAIEHAVDTGQLNPGDRLPPQRDLADALHVTVGTVSRGYTEAERRGYTYGEVGRGTYIRNPESLDPWPDNSPEPEEVDFSLSLPVILREEKEAFSQTLRDISADPKCGRLLNYYHDSALPTQKEAVANWLSKINIACDPQQLLITAGSQHGLNVVLPALLQQGQTLLTADLTYPSIKSQCRSFGIRIRGLEMDDEGICPDALKHACEQENKPSALYLVPTLQNPTSAVMSLQRRQALIEIAQKHKLWIIEDDVHSFLITDPPPALVSLAPHQTIYLSSVAKCLTPGLRTGFLLAPQELRPKLLAGIHSTMWMPPPLMVEVTARWFQNGTADRLIELKRQENHRRQQLAQNILAKYQPKSHPFGIMLWLELPDPWYSEHLIALARERGVKLIGAGAFAVNRRTVPQAVRLSIGLPTNAGLERGLRTINELLSNHPGPSY